MMMKKNLLIFAAMMSGALVVNADVIYSQQFDYTAGQDGQPFDNASFAGEGWSDNTGVITYQHDAGLSYTGNPSTGGALQYDFGGETGNRNAKQSYSDFTFGDYSAGEIFYFSALMRVDRTLNSGASITLGFDGNSVVNQPKFIVTDTQMQVEAWTNGNLNTISGPTYNVGDTLAFYMELEKGSAEGDNVLSIWFNPADLSNPGTADFVSTSDTRFGRDAGIMTGVTYGGDGVGDTQWTIDEVRIATVAIIPEPSALLLVGIALGSLLLFRRRK